ncbi:hypothetical protein [Helicobacter kayseriensis]|uniref:hypothetical protein n=1 Tax=Helicobacter kayseriensis TaxID=2905877 RepID=UPI001E618057|nr:hypothetical protein [Helicobacter kayseriensis]MCE3047815.1 hypothetical protein [Helicobacter kayseriensis]MCE3049177.1 hypothetical protein [Helicobacter kayseriensis]
MIWFSLVIVIPIFLMLISYVLVSQKKEKFWGWFWWSCLLAGVYFSSLTLGFLLTITPICLMLISYVLVAKKKKKFWGWFWWSGLLVGTYFWLLYGISFYFLDPKYYEFKNQCTQLPQPQIYNQEYWDIYIDLHSLKLQADTEKHLFFHDSKKLGKKFYANLWKTQHTIKETSWGKIRIDEQYYDDIHFATTTTYIYPTHTFSIDTGLNNQDFSFRFQEEIWECKNYD